MIIRKPIIKKLSSTLAVKAKEEEKKKKKY